MRKRVYIAGPISKGDLGHNVNQATDAFVKLAKAGFAPWCPQWSVYAKPIERWSTNGARGSVSEVYCKATPMGNEEMAHADWMGIDLPWVACADAVLRLPGESAGADMEVAEAVARGIPVYHDAADLIRCVA